MRKTVINLSLLVLIITFSFTLSSCTFIFQKGRRVDVEKISKLRQELTNLEKAKLELEDRLKQEISDKEVKVEMLEKGLVITFVSEVLFDSGKADLRNDSLKKLDKIVQVLQTTVRDLDIGVEGHTDNDPIRHSDWKSNWDLSAARGLSVLHFMIDQTIAPRRLSVTGYGEFRPVASNAMKEGKQKNRRVEIVILPKKVIKGR